MLFFTLSFTLHGISGQYYLGRQFVLFEESVLIWTIRPPSIRPIPGNILRNSKGIGKSIPSIRPRGSIDPIRMKFIIKFATF